jgi:thiamine-phosphate pyrophosphorylase
VSGAGRATGDRLGRLHVLTDTRDGRDALAVVGAALSDGPPVVQVRSKDGTDRDLHDLARALVAHGADYLGVGPTAVTTTKTGLPSPLGVAAVGAVASAVDVPVIAIGGVTVETVPALLAAGAHGVAVVAAAVSEAPDPAAATRALLAALEASAQARLGGGTP